MTRCLLPYTKPASKAQAAYRIFSSCYVFGEAQNKLPSMSHDCAMLPSTQTPRDAVNN